MSTKEEIIKQNLEFVYGKKPETQKFDPDKVSHRKSIPKASINLDNIIIIKDEYESLLPSFSCEVYLFNEDIKYPSYEHALLASKLKDFQKKQEISLITSIVDVKRFISKELKNNYHAIDPNWNEKCLFIAEHLLLDKIIRHKSIKDILLKSGNKSIYYKNDFNDLFWGVDNNNLGNGNNHLGKLLEKVRLIVNQNHELDSWILSKVTIEDPEKVRITMKVMNKNQEVLEDSKVIDSKAMLYIGKSDECDIQALHPTISRYHMLFVIDQYQQSYIIDLNSSNGTFINNSRINTFQMIPYSKENPQKVTLGVSTREYYFTIHTNANELRRNELLQKVEEDSLKDNSKDNENTIFVGNISYDAVEHDVREFFEPCGSISNINIPKDKQTGQHKGIAFITFKVFNGVLQALARDNDELLGRSIKIKRSIVPKNTYNNSKDYHNPHTNNSNDKLYNSNNRESYEQSSNKQYSKSDKRYNERDEMSYNNKRNKFE